MALDFTPGSTDDLSGEVTRGARAVVVFPDIRGRQVPDAEARLEEGRGLARAIGIEVEDSFVIPVREVRPGTLFGSGQIERIEAACNQSEADLVIVDSALSAIQQRNLEEKLRRKVIDRTGLILEIFGERAATAEGRLQVELAHLDYQAGRLVRSWTHLERQRGGFGFLGGPGETQIEADRRLIRNRMARIRRELEQVRRTRGLHRARRQRAPWPVIALVGYTNAGKSTLFNRVTRADVLAEDLLFATLDPTMRAIALPGIDKAILSDTVGFISDLPTQLVAAFRATLEEVTAADVIIHVRDISSPARDDQKEEVEKILTDLGIIAPEGGSQVTIVEAWNKWDIVPTDEREWLSELAAKATGVEAAFPISALTGDGVGTLFSAIAALLTGDASVYEFALSMSDGRKLAWLHEHGEVLSEEVAGDPDPIHRLQVRLTPRELGRFSRL